MNEGGLEVGRPDDFTFALDGLPALSAGDDGLDGVLGVGGRAGLWDGVGDVVDGRDTDVVSHVCALWRHGRGWRTRAGGDDGEWQD